MGTLFTKEGKCHLICDECMEILQEDFEEGKKQIFPTIFCDTCYVKRIDGKKLFRIIGDQGSYPIDTLRWGNNPDDVMEEICYQLIGLKVEKIVELPQDVIDSLHKAGYRP